jgi:hypothetical protein
MMIKVPFKYTASVIKKRHTNPSQETFYEWMDLEIPEIDDIDAPIATQWIDNTPSELPDRYAREKWGAAPRDGICQTRWFNNDHWWPALDHQKESRGINHETYYRDRLAPDDLAELCVQGQDRCNPLMLKDTFTQQMRTDTEYKGNALNPRDFKEVLSSNREEVLEKLLDRLNDLMIVNGQIWTRGRPPVVYLKTHVYPNIESSNPVGLLKILPEDDATIDNPNQVYSLQQFDEAREFALSFADDAQEDLNERIKLSVYISESIKNNAEQKAILQIAHYVDDEFSDHFSKDYRKMNEIPPEIGISYFEFRRSLLAFDGSDERFDDLVEAMRKFYPLCEAVHEGCSHKMSHILKRWDSKPIDIDFGTL